MIWTTVIHFSGAGGAERRMGGAGGGEGGPPEFFPGFPAGVNGH